MEFAEIAPVVRAVAISAAAKEALDPMGIAAELGRELNPVLQVLHQVDTAGLILLGDDEHGHVPLLLHAGRQYLAKEGDFDDEVLDYLASVIDDLHTRAALMTAATLLVDQFRDAVISGRAASHARDLVPPAFVGAVDEALAINLFAATVALSSRLGLGHPAGCLAEEIVAVELLEIADNHLVLQLDTGSLEVDEAEHARAELNGLFELFQDDDVLELFDMTEPADAAIAGHGWVHQQMGKVDQRLEAWFRPFGGVSPSGYYRRRGEPEGQTG
jgi:hypothetical protein